MQVGNLTEDTSVWERPENIVAGRPVYSISTKAGEHLQSIPLPALL